MKKIIVSLFLIILSFVVTGSVKAEQQSSYNDAINNQVYQPSWWETLSQTWGYEQKYLKGIGPDGGYQGSVLGIHIRPAWQWRRFEGRFDLALYKNPWHWDEWQWGRPMPSVQPKLPNFIDSFTYHGQALNLNYQEIGDLNLGHGLILNDYHPSDPYHGWKIDFTPAAGAKILLVATQEIIYFKPFISNDFASFQALRIEQSLQTGNFKWQLGFTGVHDGYKFPNPGKFPSEGNEYDISINNIIWCAPFLESGSYKGFGKANMLGVKGKLGLLSYQAGKFKTDGLFWANFFGGRYEELKWNSATNQTEPGLPNLRKESRDGYIGRIGVEITPWLKGSYLYIDDLEDTSGFNFLIKIERLKLESGLFYYRIFRDKDNYDWFIKGEAGFFDYSFHYYQDWNHKYHNEFEVSYKF